MPAASFTRIPVIAGSAFLSLMAFSQAAAQHDAPDFVPSDWNSASPTVAARFDRRLLEPGLEQVSLAKADFAENKPCPPAHLIVVRFPADTLAGMIDRKIDLTTAVNDVILNTPVTGVARLVGQPRVELRPSNDEARFNVVVTGTVYSRTTAHAGQANVHGHSITHFTATKEVTYQAGEGFRSSPPRVTARTECFTDSIAPARGGIVGRIIQRRASEQIAAQRPQVTAIARERATRRIEAAFETRLNERLAQLNQAVEFQIQLASLRTREGARRFIARTTPQFLELADTVDPGAVAIDLPRRAVPTAGTGSVEIWVRSSLVPEKLGDALQTIFTNPDQSAVLNSLAILPGPLGKRAAAALTALASENKVGVQNLGEWVVIDVNAAGKTAIAASREATTSTRR